MASLTIGKKINLGFGIVLFLLASVWLFSYTGVKHLVTDAEDVIHGNQLDGILAQREVDHLNWTTKLNASLTSEKNEKLNLETDDHKCGFGKWLYGEERRNAEERVPGIAPFLKAIEEPHKKLHDSAVKIGRRLSHASFEIGTFLREKKMDHLAWVDKVKDVFIGTSLNEAKVEMDPTKCGLGKWLHSKESDLLREMDQKAAALLSQIEAPHKALHESALKINELLAQGKREEAHRYFLENTEKSAYDCLERLDAILAWHNEQIAGMKEARSIYTNETVPALNAVQKLLLEIRGEARKHVKSDESLLEDAAWTQRSVTLMGIAAIITGMILALFISRGIIKVLRNLASSMDSSADQVASASSQVSSSSQSLAEGASEQAASIEETSSSLEEMSSMTKQNADNANQADTLMKSANEIVNRANGSMGQLNQSMDEITRASEETSKIIKTIDEIAFQTNLLALNAAVEAARAGEAGAGFAVVAGEVRNLAMRAADAAKNTANLIEGTVKKVKDGSQIVTQTNEAFGEVARSSAKVGELVAEIAAASNEQAQGIDQVNRAIAEMDKVVQQNAANAEESASASEEMNAQAEQMKIVVGDLVALVGGAPGQKRREDGGKTLTQNVPSALKRSELIAVPRLRALVTGPEDKVVQRQKRIEMKAETVIPLEEDFKNF